MIPPLSESKLHPKSLKLSQKNRKEEEKKEPVKVEEVKNVRERTRRGQSSRSEG